MQGLVESKKEIMATFKFHNSVPSVFTNSTSEDENDNNINPGENFYSPLCKSGYLTPLQRKKLREKRMQHNSNSSILDEIKPTLGERRRQNGFEIQRSKVNKNTSKNKDKISQKNRKENYPVVRFAISQLFPKKSETVSKEKKFFKALSPKRLEKVNFVMPLTLKKRLCLPIANETWQLNSKQHNKGSSLNNISPDNSFSENCEEDTPQKSTNLAKPISIPNLVKFQVNNLKNIVLFPKKILSSVENSTPVNNLGDVQSEKSQKMKNFPVEPAKLNQSVFDFDWPSDEILLERQKRARDICRRQSIAKKCKPNIHNQNENSKVNITSQQMLYPLFCGAKLCKNVKETKRTDAKRPIHYKKDSSKGGEQMIIDAGQKEIGAKVCETCSMIYCIGQEEDEKLHIEYHNKYIVNLKFHGWKIENVIGEYCDGRVIMIRKDDKSFMLKKIEDVLEIANRDLGFPTAGFPTKPNVCFLLFVSNEKRVAGCLVAESISSACHVVLLENPSTETVGKSKNSDDKVWRIGNWYSSSTPVAAICGVNRIWVASDFRRRKVASRLVDCLRCNFIYGHVVNIREIAFTDPSPDGREFAAAYTGTDNFLVYK